MERLIDRYEKKLIEQGLVDKDTALLGELDTLISWTRENESTPVLEEVFGGLNILSLLYAPPAEPYRTIIDYLARRAEGPIALKDNETRTFLHDIPVIREFGAAPALHALKRRKAAIVAGGGIVTAGTVSPEQTFVNFSSVCFSCFVKFFTDCLCDAAAGRMHPGQREAFDRVLKYLPPFPDVDLELMRAPFGSEEEVFAAVSQAGSPVVKFGFVDSVMGNISFRYKDTLYISQTGSFLDGLDGHIDACPLDNSTCAGITASSELPTHLTIVRNTAKRAVLHGHPKFAVIMSMFCEKEGCSAGGDCNVCCPERRCVGDIPIVTGETGAGKNALCNTVPAAVADHRGVIVYGHGVFTAGEDDFNTPFRNLIDIERMCREEYFAKLGRCG